MKESKLKNKKFKVAMFDIDGILNEHGGNILESSKIAIKKLRKLGVRVCFASGKHAWYIQGGLVWSGLLEKDTIIIGENGGVIFDPHSRKNIVEDKFLGDVRKLRSIFYNLYSSKEGFLKFAGMTVWEEPKESLFNLYPQNISDVPRLAKNLKEILEINNLNLYCVENPDSVDVIQEGINKATGIKRVCDWFGITMDDIVAFGDSYNDTEMLTEVGFAVTVGNGKPEIKQLVKSKGENHGFVATRNCGDGVMEAIEFMFKKKLI